MVSEVDHILRIMRASRLTREEAEGELLSEEEAASSLDRVNLGDPDFMAEINAIATVENTEAILDAAGRSGGSGGRGGGRKKAVTVDMGAYERARAVLDRRATERRQNREYRDALKSRLRLLDEASAPLYAPAPKSPLQRYIDALERS